MGIQVGVRYGSMSFSRHSLNFLLLSTTTFVLRLPPTSSFWWLNVQYSYNTSGAKCGARLCRGGHSTQGRKEKQSKVREFHLQEEATSRNQCQLVSQADIDPARCQHLHHPDPWLDGIWKDLIRSIRRSCFGNSSYGSQMQQQFDRHGTHVLYCTTTHRCTKTAK